MIRILSVGVVLVWAQTGVPATPPPDPDAATGWKAATQPSATQIPERQDTLWLSRVSAGGPFDSTFAHWRPLLFGGDRGETSYTLDSVEERVCLRAVARGGGSGLIRPVQADGGSLPLQIEADTPIRIRWSWWVKGTVPGGDLTRKEGDDFAARVYVNFRFDPSRAGPFHRLKQRLAGRRFGGEAPGKAVVYVWGNQAPAGTRALNPYTDQAAVVVVRGGVDDAGQWWTEERDPQADYRMAFGEEPTAVHSVAIMTDADDTGASAEACYGDILFLVSR